MTIVSPSTSSSPQQIAVRHSVANPSTHGEQDAAEFYPRTVNFYDNCAAIYDYLYPDHLDYSKRLFQKLLPLFRHYKIKTILDASCGVGHDMSYLLEHGFDVDGVDVSSGMLAEASSRLVARGFSRFSLHQGDVRSLSTVLNGKVYDAVLFRGNTFSNIHPPEVPDVVMQLGMVTNKKGLLCLDYRNGAELLKEKRSFEFRGFGYDKKRCGIYVSYYRLRHSKSVEIPYSVHASIFRLTLRDLFTAQRIHIRSHYVNPQDVLRAVNHNSFKVLPLRPILMHGLPCIENVVAFKDA